MSEDDGTPPRSPGVLVDEIPSGVRPIEGVATTTAGFVGPTRSGRLGGWTEVITSLAEFERGFGDGRPLVHEGSPRLHHMWHAARAFFDQGGRRLHVSRVFAEAPSRSGAPSTAYARALAAFEDVDEISIVAAPGSTAGYGADRAFSAIQALVGHAERMGRIAVIDAGDGQAASQVTALRARIDSAHAALYHPWVRVADPASGAPVVLPPSGFVAGVYARNDLTRGVSRAPANEEVVGALGLEPALTRVDEEALGLAGVNCLRRVEGGGYRVWGARTTSSDPEWKYVNVRRYLSYLERSIDRGTRWAVFEPNDEPLWSRVRGAVSDFLLREWRAGALQGARPDDAFFVRCDRSTMTQNDIDNGRLVCLVGVAPIKPAEFVIFRIGQWTADRP